MAGFESRFQEYFQREVAQKAAASLANGAEIEFQVTGDAPEKFTFTRAQAKNQVKSGAAIDPQLTMTVTPAAAEEILSNPADEVGKIGVAIMKLVVSTDANRRVSIRFHAGFLSLWNKGYLGVLTAGGSELTAYLASRGLSGMGAIKAALGKMRTKS